MRGIFITFEGIDGSGKSTQAEKLDRYLKGKGCRSVFTREPGGTEISEKIRQLLLDRRNQDMHPLTELLLYSASRAQHTEELIKPALERGDVVICVRFADSSLAYQGEGRGISESVVQELTSIATRGLRPDLTLLVDLDPRESLRRSKREDRIESEELDFYQRVREGYLRLAGGAAERIKVLDGRKQVEELHKEVVGIVTRELGL